MSYPILTAEEAAQLIKNGQSVGVGGFTAAGSPKLVFPALAAIAEHLRETGQDLRVKIISGASTAASVDGVLARAGALSFRTPYQSDPLLRQQINEGQVKFLDLHLSSLPQAVRLGWFGRLDWAVVEAVSVTQDGEILLTSGVGAAPTLLRLAEKVIIEVNSKHPPELLGIHDLYEPQDPPLRREIPLYSCRDRIGAACVRIDPAKIAAVVQSDIPDHPELFAAPSEATSRIGGHVAEFLVDQLRCGRIPSGFLPLQSGVGDIQNSVLRAIAAHPDIPRFEIYSEVLQDASLELIKRDRAMFASGCALTVSAQVLEEVYANLKFWRAKLVLRPQEITNHPEVIRRLGLISVNTALECDIFGNVNSTHVLGSKLVNGIGGSGDFARNAFISIFVCPSTAKAGRISTIVPCVTHQDHSEHSVQVIATEHGLADLRGKSPRERAQLMINNCAHPDFRPELNDYLRHAESGHIPVNLKASFAMHRRFLETGDMRGADWG